MKALFSSLIILGSMAGLASCSRSPVPTMSSAARAAHARREATTRSSKMETATFAAGCFWGVEETFRQTKGVTATAVGYAGGLLAKPTYEDVCTDKTGHAEAVQVEYDPGQISYEQLLDVFWSLHDPTTPNRQGPDVGTQYRSVIFYHSGVQQAAALASKERLERSGKYRRPIVTEIVPASAFWPAEEYHQRYLEKRGMAACRTH